MKYLGLLLFLCPHLSLANPKIMEALDRFAIMSERASLEDFWAHQRRLSSHRYLNLEFQEPRLLDDPQMRREWYLRLGPAGVPLTLAELDGVRQAKLFDELLWTLLRENIAYDFWDPSIDWAQIRLTMGSYLSSHPLSKVAIKEKHGSWWRWMMESRVREGDPEELRALDLVLRARVEENPLKKLGVYVEVLNLVQTVDSEAALRVASEVLSRMPTETQLRRRVFREYFEKNPKSFEASKAFALLAEVVESQRNYKEALELAAYSLLIRVQMGENLKAIDLKKIGDGEYQSGDYKKAVAYYARALAADREGLEDLDVMDLEVKYLLARYYSGDLAKSEGYDAFEDILSRAFQTNFRDELLQGYASYLESVKDFLGAREIWIWNFKYSSVRERRVQGIQKASQISGDLLKDQKPSLALGPEALQWLSLLGSWKRMNPKDPLLEKEIARARKIVSSLGLSQESMIRASLKELEAQ
jgi:tetratricopeptide (TPR) repeat protein